MQQDIGYAVNPTKKCFGLIFEIKNHVNQIIWCKCVVVLERDCWLCKYKSSHVEIEFDICLPTTIAHRFHKMWIVSPINCLPNNLPFSPLYMMQDVDCHYDIFGRNKTTDYYIMSQNPSRIYVHKVYIHIYTYIDLPLLALLLQRHICSFFVRISLSFSLLVLPVFVVFHYHLISHSLSLWSEQRKLR